MKAQVEIMCRLYWKVSRTSVMMVLDSDLRTFGFLTLLKGDNCFYESRRGLLHPDL